MILNVVGLYLFYRCISFSLSGYRSWVSWVELRAATSVHTSGPRPRPIEAKTETKAAIFGLETDSKVSRLHLWFASSCTFESEEILGLHQFAKLSCSKRITRFPYCLWNSRGQRLKWESVLPDPSRSGHPIALVTFQTSDSSDCVVCWYSEAGSGGDDLLLLMQFPAGEIGRKVALTLSPHVDDDEQMTPDKFRAREFPVGTGLFTYHYSVAIVD